MENKRNERIIVGSNAKDFEKHDNWWLEEIQKKIKELGTSISKAKLRIGTIISNWTFSYTAKKIYVFQYFIKKFIKPYKKII